MLPSNKLQSCVSTCLKISQNPSDLDEPKARPYHLRCLRDMVPTLGLIMAMMAIKECPISN